MKGNIVSQIVIYLVFAIAVFSGVTSCTNKTMPADVSNLVGFIFAAGVFVVLNIFSFLLGLRNKKGKK